MGPRLIDYVNREGVRQTEDTPDPSQAAQGRCRGPLLYPARDLEVLLLIPRFKSRDELLEEEFNKFVADHKSDEVYPIPAIKYLFKGLRHQRPHSVTSSKTKQFTDIRDQCHVFPLGIIWWCPSKYRNAHSRVRQGLCFLERVRCIGRMYD